MRIRSCLFWLAWALLACGCAQTVPEGETPRPTVTGPTAPGFSLLSPLGDPVALEPGSQPGEPTLIAFWSPSWDPDHAAEEIVLRQLLERYGNRKLRVIAVAYDEKPEQIRNYLRQSPVPYEVAMGDEGIYDAYRLEAIPTMVLVAPDGGEAGRWEGHQRIESLAEKVEPLLSGGN
ncbi:MAG: TlpA family protein disulfide reductase [Armatimonadetes bacterium]|nr:TlpA family protein disulfide reductase [Armatimonadota bacterium]